MPTRVILDFDPQQPDAPAFEGDTSELVYFLSWAFSQRYGASHELSQVALLLRSEHKIDLTPLLTFADRDVEDPADADVLGRSWQDAAPLAGCCERVAEVLRSNDEHLTGLIEEYPSLIANIEELGRIAAWGDRQGARIRITYVLEDE